MRISSNALRTCLWCSAASRRVAGAPRSISACRPFARNRILFEPEEVRYTNGRLTATIPGDDPRTVHIRSVLRLLQGDSLRVGIVDGGASTATVSSPSCSSEPPPDSTQSDPITLQWDGDGAAGAAPAPPPPPNIDLLLAMPRPKVLRRMWAPLAALGVGSVFLTNAEKVERYYFDSHLRDGATVREQLLRGMEQAGDTRLPQVLLALRLPPLLDCLSSARAWPEAAGAAEADARAGAGAEAGLGGSAAGAGQSRWGPWGAWLVGGPERLPPRAEKRLLAHPGAPSVTAALAAAGSGGGGGGGGGGSGGAGSGRVLLAVGPEGGWTDFELALLERAGFVQAGIGGRPLTTDVAVPCLMAAIREATGTWAAGQQQQ